MSIAQENSPPNSRGSGSDAGGSVAGNGGGIISTSSPLPGAHDGSAVRAGADIGAAAAGAAGGSGAARGGG